VLYLEDHRGAPMLEAIDASHLPQRSCAVEGVFGHGRRKVEELTHRTGLAESDVADVIGEIEVGIGDPLWWCQAERIFHDALAKSWHGGDTAFDCGGEVLRTRGMIEHKYRDHRCPQKRIALDTPHDGVGAIHPARLVPAGGLRSLPL
jgi:hypothetical protein